MNRLMTSEDRDRVSRAVMVGGPALAVLGLLGGFPPIVWLLSAACGGFAIWFRWDGRHHRSLAEDVESAIPSGRSCRVEERPLPAGLLLVLIPSPPFTDAQLRAALAGPVAAHGCKMVNSRRAKRGMITVTLVELMPC